MSWEALKSAVSAVITDNGNNEITGSILETLINENLIPQLGEAKYKGIAIPSTAPGTPQSAEFYMCTQEGVYSNFGGIAVNNGISILKYENGWVKDEIFNFENNKKEIIKDTSKVNIYYTSIADIINIDTVNNLIEFPSLFYVTGIIDGFSIIKSYSNLTDIPFVVSGNSIQVLYFDMGDKSLKLNTHNGSSNLYANPNITVLMIFNESTKSVVSCGFKYTIDGRADFISENDLLKKNNVSLIYSSNSDYVNFNFGANQIEFPSLFYVVGTNSNINATKIFNNLENLPFSLAGNSINVLLYNSQTNSISVENISGTPVWQKNIYNQIIATFIPSSKTISTTGWSYSVDGLVDDEFDPDVQRLILPDNIYICDNSLVLKKYNLTASKYNRENNLLFFKNNNKINEINNELILDSGLVGSAEISQVPINGTGRMYKKTINIINTDPSSKTGTKTFLGLGDSLTGRGVSAYTKNKIEDVSACVLNTLGIMTDSQGAQCEGRGGWEFANYIGLNNLLDGASIITPQTIAGTGSATKNPFLSLASANDKTNHPEWCFTNTGVANETSYAENNGLGDYYIFSWEYYFNTQGIPAPNFVNIGLSTNDIVKNIDWLDNSRLGLEIILKQLNTYCVDNSINIDVSVVPTVTWADVSSNSSRWIKAAEWCEKMLTDINNYIFSNITVEAIFVHIFQNDKTSFIGGGVDNGNVNSFSTVKDISYGDIFHPDGVEFINYGSALGSFLLSKY